MASILDINAVIGPICPENLSKYGWDYDDTHRIYTKPIYNMLIHSNVSRIDSEFIRNSRLPNIAFAYISIHWDYPMLRDTHDRLPLIDVEPKPTFRFGIRGYRSAAYLDSYLEDDLIETEHVSDMGMLSVLFDKYVNKLKDEGIPERYFINC